MRGFFKTVSEGHVTHVLPWGTITSLVITKASTENLSLAYEWVQRI